MAWELMNEPRCGSARRLRKWVQHMSGFIKSIDPHHLVAVGDEGWLPDLVELPHIDFATFHLYPEKYAPGKPPREWGLQWIDAHVDAAGRAFKPAILGEYGIADRGTRDAIYRDWLDRLETKGGAGAIMWMLGGLEDDGQPYRYPDEFTQYFPLETPAIAHYAARASDTLLASRHATSDHPSRA
jgi:mannan endo-1,4-beta-mannosidase